MIKSKTLTTHSGNQVHILSEESDNPNEILEKNRNILSENKQAFFDPQLSDLHDPFLLPDMGVCVERILSAKEKGERVIIFGDYDVDGVSSTAILVRFLKEIGVIVSYRLPHRVHDGYGLKSYLFDEVKEKGVSLVITVDCGTRDIVPIQYAKSLGIDVIVTDHHAVPNDIPQEVIGIINPKRNDSLYPFSHLAGAGVAFKLIHALSIVLFPGDETAIENTLGRYIDFAALGTVADCMPLVGENRTITTLGLRQMQHSESAGLKKFLEDRDQVEGNADIIGFQIGPRINAAGRMDTPMTALRWLLASEDRTDEFFAELEHLNETRKNTTESHFQKALQNIDTSKPILFYDAHDFEHGIIGLVAGKLTEIYNKPTIIMKNGHNHPLTSRKGDTVSVASIHDPSPDTPLSIGSCRAPEWCNLIELLDQCKEFFVRYGGHRQAAGFTIETEKILAFQEKMYREIAKVHDITDLPKKAITVESALLPDQINTDIINIIDRFRPFGIGNPRPLWILKNITILTTRPLGQEEKHLSITISENPHLKIVLWNATSSQKPHFIPGNILSLIIEIERNEWKGNISVQAVVKDFIV